MSVLESKIENDFCDDVRGVGYLPIKINIMGFRGLPDRLILGPGRFILFIEFKRPVKPGRKRKAPGKLQQLIIKRIKDYGFQVAVINSEEDANLLAQRLIRRLQAT